MPALPLPGYSCDGNGGVPAVMVANIPCRGDGETSRPVFIANVP